VVAHLRRPTRDGCRSGPGAKREGGALLTVDHQASGGPVGAEMRQVVRHEVRRHGALQVAGALGRATEDDLRAGIGRDDVDQVGGEMGEVLVDQDEPEPGGLRLGQDVVQAAGERKEVLALVEVETAHASPPSAGCPGADGLPDLGDEERPEEPGRLVAEDTLGQPAQEDPTVEDLAVPGEFWWPSVGTSRGRLWGVLRGR